MPEAAAPRDVYTERLAYWAAQEKALQRRRRNLGYFRLLIVLAFLAAIWFSARGPLPWWSAVGPMLLFIALVSIQSGTEKKAQAASRSIRFFERGIARLDHTWQGGGESGDRFADPHHPYASDLDLFGRGSLFELLSTARTRGGEATLAAWLKASAPVEELRARQQAVDELRPLLDLRRELAVIGEDIRAGLNPEHLKAWATSPSRPFSSLTRIAALVFSIAAGSAIVWWFATGFIGIEARRTVAIVGLFEGGFALFLRARVLQTLFTIHEPAADLDRFSEIIAVIEAQTFRCARLQSIRARIASSGKPASQNLARLRRLMEMIDSRDNVFVRIFGPPLLWTTQLSMAIENWRALHGSSIPRWLDAMSEMEALAALAGYAWENPLDPFPEFTKGAVFFGEELGHPLLPAARCITNSVHLREPVQLVVVSGSNMSGKSTLLRAVGINAVLALAGAPVRARALTLSPLSLGASIRTMDSLEEGHSRFMAEILRLRQILELPRPALFLLDELLHGTNSHDRAIGAEGLIRALLARGAVGLTSTHDLSLAKVADSLGPAARNVHFDDRLEAGKLVFDYRMKPGVVTRSNALDLMRAVGLDV